MPKTALAERILEMVTSSQRAASIIGDLLEEASNRGASWFWLSLLRISTSHLLQDLRLHWLRMIWLGFSGFLECVIVGILAEQVTLHSHSYFATLRSYSYLATAQYLVHLCVPILIGWHIAKRSHGHELASGISVISVWWIYRAVEVLPMFWMYRSLETLLQLQGGPFRYFMHAMFLVAPLNTLIMLGALLCRFRTNVRYRKLQFS